MVGLGALRHQKTWTLSKGTGTKTVYTEFKDADGNVSSPPASDTIRRRR